MKGELYVMCTVFVSLSFTSLHSNAMGFCKFQRLVDSLKTNASNYSTIHQATTSVQKFETTVNIAQTVTFDFLQSAASDTSTSLHSYESIMKGSADSVYTTKMEKDAHMTTEAFPTTTMGCPENMEAGNCTSSCQATCQDPFGCPGNCTKHPNCVCPNGFFLQDDECASMDACNCFIEEEGVLLPEGEILVSSRCDKLFSCKGNKIHLNESYQCDAQATCDKREAGRRCYCNKRYAGDGQTCTRIVDCYQLLRDGETTSGVYTVFPVNWPNKTLNVSCDMTTDGGGWTVFQKRFDKSVDFSRDWKNYKNGFGDLSGEFWLGNEAIHTITDATTYTLRVELTTDAGLEGFAVYENFHVASEAGLYALGVSGYNTSSTAGDSLSLHDQMNFSTFDMDNDVSRNLNCAKMYSGGWWYNECSFANLNSNTQSQWMLNYYNDGINKTELKLRPKGVKRILSHHP